MLIILDTQLTKVKVKQFLGVLRPLEHVGSAETNVLN